MRRSLAVALTLLVAAACGKKQSDTPPIQTATVTRQDIVVDVEATGVIQPINAVEVKSKASGQITSMPVSTGDHVKTGQLLVQVDPRDVRNRYDQAVAAVRAAQSNLAVTKAQKDREDALYQQQVVTANEKETADLAYANAQSQLVTAETNLDIAKQQYEDATVRAPTSGTVIAKNVSVGTVITSATNSVSGGTTLLVMADLSTILDSALVNESDIGNVRAGQTATVKVDAYPNRTFTGIVQKIEPQATVQQSVTLFPVLIRLDNREGLLMPGMNSDVSVLVSQQNNVLAVPNDAVRSPRDAMAAAAALGLDPDQVQQELKTQFGGFRRNGGGTRSSGTAGGEVALPPQQGGQAGQGGQGGQQVVATAAQCQAVTKAMSAHPAQARRLQQLRQQMMSGGMDFQQARTTMMALYDSIGVDPRVARSCQRQQSGAQGGQGGGALQGGAELPAENNGTVRPHPGLVFVQDSTGAFAPRMVMLGAGNYDVTAVLSGLKEGEKVALISAAAMQQARQNMMNRIRSRAGIPGMQSNGNSRGSASRGGGGGGRNGGR